MDHFTPFGWMQRFTHELIDCDPPVPIRAVRDRWVVDEKYVKVTGVWRSVCRAGPAWRVIEVVVSKHSDFTSDRRFFTTALMAHRPAEVITGRSNAGARECDRGPDSGGVIHNTEQCQNNRVETGDGRRKARLTDVRAEDRPDGGRADQKACVRAGREAGWLRAGIGSDTDTPLDDGI
ncbi:MAG: DDE-type integrase/transposase/recombinase [bacterium]|nr:DDE-type integrase/transposase/recombinase [bacterium]